jgi:hypothetical protein
MRVLILASAVGLALATSAQAAPVWRSTARIELGAALLTELVRDGCGRGWHRDRWRDQSGDWHWGHCIPNGGPDDAWSAGWSHSLQDWRAEPPRRGGVTNTVKGASFLVTNDPERRPMKTATDRAVEAIEAAEKIFADEMAATLYLTPAAKAALIATITAAIQTAGAEQTKQLTWVM